MLGRNLGRLQLGIAQGVTDVLVGKILDENGNGEATWLIAGLIWALDRDADVISLSLGYNMAGHVEHLVDIGYGVAEATNLARKTEKANEIASESIINLAHCRVYAADPVILAAVGNESNRPISVLEASIPACLTGVVGVGAIIKPEQLALRPWSSGEAAPLLPTTAPFYGLDVAKFSNNGADLVAPGVDIISAKAGSRGCALRSGTSMAVPHAAAVAAQWWHVLRSAGESPSSEDVLMRMRDTAWKSFNSTVPSKAFGSGLVQCPTGARGWRQFRPISQSMMCI